ncbi:MAG: aminotransferase class V-fold PLP-dependent enzyme [Legionellales bacterium]|nr:aminotransferase class V-fold PLP-dependent enzyme [Legionellales bacterium]
MSESLIFTQGQRGRFATAQAPMPTTMETDLPQEYVRQTPLGLPEVSELQVVRHFTRLSQYNFGIDTHFYPLGSCTMKYNPRGVQHMVSKPSLLNGHPLLPAEYGQGLLQCLYELQEYIKDLAGMPGVSLIPMAGSQGELAGVAMIRAYHQSRGDHQRTEMLIPDAAHGTNPASAVMCGFTVKEIPTAADGDIDLAVLKTMVGPQTAGIMLTNPSTLGVFTRQIATVAQVIHQAGGLLYYDGANLNAILGRVRPGEMGFDVMHLNLHKTFATPHGGGGPGAGPVAVSERLKPFLPIPLVAYENGQYRWVSEGDGLPTIGRLSSFMGNVGILLRAYAYIRLLGRTGLQRVAEFATLNANYLMVRLQQVGFQLAYPKRRASHEFIISLSEEKKQFGVTAMDVAKRLLDYGFHAPTTYFPLLIPECLLIEPTETESKQELDAFVDAMCAIRQEMQTDAQLLKQAPHTMPVRRLDDVRAARELDLIWCE